MPYGLYLAAEGAQAQARRLEVISNNLANVDTPGFKRDLAVAQARYSEAIEQGLDEPGAGGINDIGGGVTIHETATQFSAGPLKQTGIPTDMAIDGKGFFQIEVDGQRLLTRAGNFRVSPLGQLTTQEGYGVLGTGGVPITIDPNRPWSVTPGGSISQDGALLPLALVEPASRSDLVKVGKKLFEAPGEPVPVEPSERSVRGGFLELSGVKPTEEMMELIATTRAFEANVSLIRTHDEMLGNLLGRVLRA